MKTVYFAGATMLALFGSTSVLAQATSPQTPQPTDAADSTSDIIVTASKREKTLQDTPISVAVTTAESIERAQVRDLIDLQSLVPSLKVGQLQTSANTNFSIRGFGNGANNAGIEPSVGVFIDGVYRSRSAAQIGDLPNIKRVEVLRGPQSTLFGKNASAGIISIITEAPKFKFGGNIEASYGNFNAVVIKGDVTGPISETVAFSIGGNYNRRDGYVRDLGYNGEGNNRNRYGGRAQLLFQPSSDLKIRAIGDFDQIDEICCAVANVFAGPTVGIINALAGGRAVDPNSPFSYTSYSNFRSTNNIKNYGGSIQGDYDFGSLALTSITAYRKVDARTNQDSDFTSADLLGRNSQDLKIDTFTQEVRLASNFDGPLNFLVGGFYFDEKIDQKNQILFGTQFRPYGNALIQAATGGALNVATLEGTFGALEGAPTRYVNTFFRAGDGLNEAYRLSDSSYSLFGTVDFKITDGLTLTGGINYTDDRKRFSTNVISNDVFSGLNLDAPQFAPFRNTLLFQGALAQTIGTQLGLGRSATAAEIGAFAGANGAAFAAISAGSQAFATANQNNPAANPLNGLKGFQFLPPFLNVPNAVESGRTSDNNLSYTARINYKINRHLNVYATYATGFKASSINLSRDSRPSPADLAAIRVAGFATPNLGSGSRLAGPEDSTVYEIGVKGSFQGFAFNLAVFKQELKGFQNNTFRGAGFVLANAEKQSTNGFEFDATVSPIKDLNFSASLTYLDPKYDLFTLGSAFNPATNTVVDANLSGVKPSGISNYSISVAGTYKARLAGDKALVFHADYAHDSAFQIAQGLPNKAQPESLNASISLELRRGLEITAWGRNLTEPKYNPVIFPSVAQSGSLSGYPSPPKTYGGSIRYKF